MPTKRNTGSVITVILILIAILFLSSSTTYISQNSTNSTNYPKPTSISELSTAGFVQVQSSAAIDPSTGGGLVTLTGNCYAVTGNTDPVQAQSIIDGLAGTLPANGRPSTQDLMKDIFQNFGIKVLMVKVVGIENNNFIGNLILQQGNKIVSFDSRPSDGIAVAVRTNATIYFNQTLLQQYGQKIC